jgi:inhibitor of KinA
MKAGQGGGNMIRFRCLGEQALIVELGDRIDPAVHRKVLAFCKWLRQQKINGVVEWVPSYTGVTIHFDPFLLSPFELQSKLAGFSSESVDDGQDRVRVIEIPVCYGGEFGPDLEELARFRRMDAKEVIRIHAGGTYLVYMIGFVPGFAYLGGMSPRIAMPRRDSPRPKIPAGSVGIAGEQTGVYPLEVPGGWRIIGRTPLPLFLPEQSPPSLLRAGDLVQFVPIDEPAYHAIKEKCNYGELPVAIRYVKGGKGSESSSIRRLKL